MKKRIKQSDMKLVIGIPTFNRSKYLIQNLKNIETICEETHHFDDVTVFISDNCSTDDTVEKISVFKKTSHLNIDVNFNTINKGISNNLVFILQEGSNKGDFLLLLGDDDLFSKEYFLTAIDLIYKYQPACVLPNYLPTDNNYKIIGEPREPISDEPIVSSSLESNLRLSFLCHQMSGVIYNCAFWSKDFVLPMQTSMYPQIYLGILLSDKGTFIHIQNNPILVIQNNSKAWKYDATGYSIDILSGFYYVNVPKGKYFKLCRDFLNNNRWRLSFGIKHPLKFWKVVLGEKRVRPCVKVFLLFYMPLVAAKTFLRMIFKKRKKQ